VLWVIGVAAVVAVVATAGAMSEPDGLSLAPVNANTKSTGYAPPNVLSPQLKEIVVAQGSMRVENPDPSALSYYGYDNDKLNSAGQPVMVPVAGLARHTRPSPTRTPISCSRTG